MTDELPDDPLWFKDAIIYEIHIRAFQDSTNDGIGDINGLISRLDYLSDLGITAIWVLPFYPSPLRDGGYDIADYTSVHEHYGTRDDFARLLQEAHRRGIRVITELVLNHTSAEHPWFQRARRAAPGSPEREFYVWSDTPAPYGDTRIIFKDYETSNWSWDPVAKAYYWHRFYAHQPDLNFDNPAVHAALFKVLDFWFEMGVDGMRLDAVPYLYEREGTSCENLPETHAFLKQLRAHIDGKFKNRMLLAEANQWPADAAAYFGDGDECHMNFHFPLMPRMFMALETEDSFPIINILKRTPRIPESCQWATFLRNHDELTLEMVTDEDRDTMYRGYAAERAARINLGIRRRLAPLLGVRRKIELMTALLLSLPGTPVLYYGDEIGMGDNIYLGDRDGVRTPMQWSSDRNGGFSRANPQKLYLPTIIDPEYHYEAINVEAQQGNSSSLLWWMKRTLAKRKEHPVFGRGAIEFVTSDNPRVLAFVRELAGERVLVVANLSRFVQCVRLELAALAGTIPVELFGKLKFPDITDAPYFLALGPYDFYWFAIAQPQVEVTDRPALTAKGAWTALLEPKQRPALVRALVQYAQQRRWYRGKARVRKNAQLGEVIRFSEQRYAIVELAIEYDRGRPETYVIPLAFAEDADPGTPGQVIANVVVDTADRGQVTGVLYDALCSDAFDQMLLATMRAGGTAQLAGGSLPRLAAQEEPLVAHATTVDQTNSGVIYGDRFLLKLFRVLDDGPNAELELGRFFAEHAPGYRGVARLAGWLETGRGTLGTLFELVPNHGDAWQLTQDALDRYYDRLVSDDKRPEAPPIESIALVELAKTKPPDRAVDWIGPVLDRIRLLGTRTAELHRVLAGSDDALFAPEPYDIMHQQSIYGSAIAHAARTFDLLRAQRRKLAPELVPLADDVLAREAQLDRALAQVTQRRIDVARIRLHGDYHLGQVLWTGDDFVIIDFEGEPGRPLSQRRFKRAALRDVAGMIRSLHYASAAALRNGKHRPEDVAMLAPWSRAWSEWMSSAFLAGYLEVAQGSRVIPKTAADLQLLLDFFLIEKCVYEIGYELDHRPEWVEIPAPRVARAFGVTEFGELDAHLLREGTHPRLHEKLGSHLEAGGVRFGAWAPHAAAVSVIGDFNGWKPGADPLVPLADTGVWTGRVAGLAKGALYKLHVISEKNGYQVAKADPFAIRHEAAPGTASIVWEAHHAWRDAAWMTQRAAKSALDAPVAIYECHLGSWKRDGERLLTYREVAPLLVEHVTKLGFTHVELMPLTEHPFFGSWGYETTGYFAATARYGTPEDLMFLVDELHAAGLAVILDWVPAHFPTDEHGLGYFDGTPLFEHADRRLGFHPEWNTAIFDFGRQEVRSFLLSSALYWLEQFHVDGLRVDGVASMLYRDYGREAGEWIPNDRGGNEYFEAVELLQRLTAAVAREQPGTITVAEESTAWPNVTSSAGLGFTYKWDMGWMHDTLAYLARDPVHRKFHHNQLTMRGLYAWSERFVLPLSHDEVVHGKGALVAKFPGDRWQRLASLRLLYAYMYSQPGKKLLFMGGELAQEREWNHDRALDWPGDPQIQLLVGELNRLYRATPQLHELDCDPAGFRWIDPDDAEHSVLTYERRARDGSALVCALNFTPIPRHGYRIGVARAGTYRELLNTDAPTFGGSGQGNLGAVESAPVRSHGRDHSLTITVPPLGAVYLMP